MRNTPRAFFVWQAIILAAVALGLLLSFRGWQWDGVRSQIRHAHPRLPQVSPVDLARWLGGPPDKRPVLFDVRTRAEFDYSHIPGAVWIAPDAVPADLTLPADKGAPLVFYCATGQHAAALAESVLTDGYTRVWLLDGGLFRWANEDHALTGAHGPASAVRAQDGSMQYLLKRQRRAGNHGFLP